MPILKIGVKSSPQDRREIEQLRFVMESGNTCLVDPAVITAHGADLYLHATRKWDRSPSPEDEAEVTAALEWAFHTQTKLHPKQ